MKGISLLLATKPIWFETKSLMARRIDGVCSIDDDTSVSEVRYALTIEALDDQVYAREEVPGSTLPSACYDRHIMRGGYFCLGLDYGDYIQDEQAAGIWWASLEAYLKLQGVASATSRWPRSIEIDHGVAGRYHRKAIDAAAALGIADEYHEALLGEDSWITDRWIKADPTGSRLINGRAACPRGCLKKKGRRRLRCECCGGAELVSLIHNERSREKAIKKFWQEIRADKTFVCCGTMANCPLRTN